MPDVAGSFLHKEALLADFARDLHWIFIHKHIPPFQILNEALLAGYSPREAEWEPFQVTEDEYEELVNELLSNPREGFKRYSAPEDVKSMTQWSTWLQSIGC